MSSRSNILNKLFLTYDKVMYLKIFVENPNLREKYVNAVIKHNNKLINNIFIDAGFDLFLPDNCTDFGTLILNDVNFGIKCSAKMQKACSANYATGFYLYPRSSLSKTPLRLANSVGIVDAGYRGSLRGLFDCIYKEHEYVDYMANPYDRLLQICSPGLEPIYVELVNSEEELGEVTERGTGGVGSTNI